MVNVATFNLLICVAECELNFFFFLWVWEVVWLVSCGGVCEHEFPFHECHEALNVTFSLPA